MKGRRSSKAPRGAGLKWMLPFLLTLSACQPQPAETALVTIRFQLTQYEPLSRDRQALRNAAVAAAAEGKTYFLVSGFACDTGGFAASRSIADRRARRGAEIVLAEAQRGGVQAAIASSANGAVLIETPREPHRRIELRAYASAADLRLALQAANQAAADANRRAQTGESAGREAGPPFWIWLLVALLIAALVVLIVVWLLAGKRDAKRLRHQLSVAEAQSIAALTGGQIVPLAAAEPEAGEGARHGRLTRSEGVRGIMNQMREKEAMAAKKKKSATRAAKITPISIRGAVDKPFESMTLKQLAGSPVHALEGLTPRHARLLEEAFGIRNLEDLARLKYVEIARAICLLAQYED